LQANNSQISPAVSLQPTLAILPTAVIRIFANNQFFKVRAVIDAGIPHTKISSRLVEQLGLKTSTMADRWVCSFTIKGTSEAAESLDVVARVGQNFQILTPARTIDARVREPFAGLILADPDFYVSSSVLLTLGIDVYARILRNGLVKPGGNLLAQYSIFGFLVSGMCAY